MKSIKRQNSWIYTLCIILVAISIAFLCLIPIQIKYISAIVTYFDPTQIKDHISIWIFINILIALFSNSQKASSLNTGLFSGINFISYSLFSYILHQTMPTSQFTNWILWLVITVVSSYFIWLSKKKDMTGMVVSTILLTILFSTSFNYSNLVLTNVPVLNLLLFVFLVILLYKGTKETLIIVVLSFILAILLNTFQIHITF